MKVNEFKTWIVAAVNQHKETFEDFSGFSTDCDYLLELAFPSKLEAMPLPAPLPQRNAALVGELMAAVALIHSYYQERIRRATHPDPLEVNAEAFGDWSFFLALVDEEAEPEFAMRLDMFKRMLDKKEISLETLPRTVTAFWALKKCFLHLPPVIQDE